MNRQESGGYFPNLQVFLEPFLEFANCSVWNATLQSQFVKQVLIEERYSAMTKTISPKGSQRLILACLCDKHKIVLHHCPHAKGGVKDWKQVWHQPGQQLPQTAITVSGFRWTQSSHFHCAILFQVGILKVCASLKSLYQVRAKELPHIQSQVHNGQN